MPSLVGVRRPHEVEFFLIWMMLQKKRVQTRTVARYRRELFPEMLK